MSLLIGDGRGGGTAWEIQKHRGQVDAHAESAFAWHADEGDAYSWSNVGYDMTAADTILSLRNTSPTQLLRIQRVTMSTGIAGYAQHHVTRGSAALAGTVVTGFNLGGGNNVAEADAREDETTNSAQGTLIGTTALVLLTQVIVEFGGALILGTNDAYGIDYTVDDTTNLPLITISGFYQDKDS